jgi:3-methyladenine DNA glycosylase AlkD
MTAAAAMRRLRSVATPERAEGALRYFKCGPGEYGEGDRFLGVTAPDLRKITREFRELALAEVVTLLESPWHEARSLALLILVEQYKRGDEATRQRIYDLYLRSTARINNWDLVDVSAPHIVGAHRNAAMLTKLARSKSLWERRIAIIATQHLIRAGELDETLRIAEILVRDEHDLIHKAVGWMLRELADRDRPRLEQFLASHIAHMPRTMLRYAIEKFPPELRRKWMEA